MDTSLPKYDPEINYDEIDYPPKQSCRWVHQIQICDSFSYMDEEKNQNLLNDVYKKEDKLFLKHIKEKNIKQLHDVLIKLHRTNYIRSFIRSGSKLYILLGLYGENENESKNNEKLWNNYAVFYKDINSNKTSLLTKYHMNGGLYMNLIRTYNQEYIGVLLPSSNNKQSYEITFYQADTSIKIDNSTIKNIDISVTVAWYKKKGYFFQRDYIIHEKNNTNTKSQQIWYFDWNKKEEKLIKTFYIPNIKLKLNVTNNNKYLIIIVESPQYHRGNLLYFFRIPKQTKKWISEFDPLIEIVNKWKRSYKYITSIDTKIYVLTDRLASKRCIYEIDLKNTKPKCHCQWKPLIEEDTDRLLLDAISITKFQIFLIYYEHNFTMIQIYDIKENKILNQKRFTNGYISHVQPIDPNKENNDEVFFLYQSYLEPPVIYMLKLNDFSFKKQLASYHLEKFNPKDYECTRLWWHRSAIWIKSRQICTIYHKKGTKNEKQLCLIVISGGFGEINLPKYNRFFVNFLLIFNAKIIIINIPGNGDYGRIWHNLGIRTRKYKFLQYLNNILDILYESYATHCILYGHIHGGMIAAACATKFPLKISGIICLDPIIDILNIKDSFYLYEFGNIKMGFGYIANALKFSPLHNILQLENKIWYNYFPPTLMYCINDGRIHKSEAAKFILQLQYNAKEAKYNKTPFFLTYENLDGYHIKFEDFDLIEEMKIHAKIIAFLVYAIKTDITFENIYQKFNNDEYKKFIESEPDFNEEPPTPPECHNNKECALRKQWNEIKLIGRPYIDPYPPLN